MTAERKLILAMEEYIHTCSDEKLKWELRMTIKILERKIADKIGRVT